MNLPSTISLHRRDDGGLRIEVDGETVIDDADATAALAALAELVTTWRA